MDEKRLTAMGMLPLRRLLAAVGAACLASCGIATSPQATDPRIDLTTTVLAVGEAVSLRIVGAPSRMPIAWNFEGQAAKVSGQELTAQQPGEGVLTATTTDHVATAVVHVVPSVEGAWSGTLHQPGCQKVSGEGPYYCGKSANGWDRPIQMQVWQSGESLKILRIEISIMGTTEPLPSVIGQEGSLQIPTANLVGEPDSGTMELHSWHVTTDPGGSIITGDVVLEQRFVSSLFGPQHYRNVNQLSMRRQQ
jgi:hypothetical protein